MWMHGTVTNNMLEEDTGGEDPNVIDVFLHRDKSAGQSEVDKDGMDADISG